MPAKIQEKTESGERPPTVRHDCPEVVNRLSPLAHTFVKQPPVLYERPPSL
jgi:hypothetical protein